MEKIASGYANYFAKVAVVERRLLGSTPNFSAPVIDVRLTLSMGRLKGDYESNRHTLSMKLVVLTSLITKAGRVRFSGLALLGLP